MAVSTLEGLLCAALIAGSPCELPPDAPVHHEMFGHSFVFEDNALRPDDWFSIKGRSCSFGYDGCTIQSTHNFHAELMTFLTRDDAPGRPAWANQPLPPLQPICSNCLGILHWQEVFEHDTLHGRGVVINGSHWTFAEAVDPREVRIRGGLMVGCGGRVRMARTSDGRGVLISNNCWHQGELPPEIRAVVPDNAEWLSHDQAALFFGSRN